MKQHDVHGYNFLKVDDPVKAGWTKAEQNDEFAMVSKGISHLYIIHLAGQILQLSMRNY